jgi:hypothetical protein
MRFWRRRAASRPAAHADQFSADDIRMKGRAMLAVRYLGEEIAERAGRDARWTSAFKEGVDGLLEQVAAVACSRAGISIADYRKVYSHDLQVVGAQQRAIEQAVHGA